MYRNRLTEYEQTEILDYPEIWFLGLDATKVQGRASSAQNHGYDDDNGSYLKVSANSFRKLFSKSADGAVIALYNSVFLQMALAFYDERKPLSIEKYVLIEISANPSGEGKVV